jgi:hypothetical protein
MNLPRHAELWFAPYLKQRARRAVQGLPPERVWLTIADHYEPLGMGVGIAKARERVAQWRDRWPRISADGPTDSAGQQPQYTFFYPQEEYHKELLETIAQMVRGGVGDVEVHLHHDHETPDAFRGKVNEFCARLSEEHGLLRKRDGRTVFGFIHGNWALDNSRPDGKWCGLKGEIALLRELGCYADFTMPSIPSPTQSRLVNRIFWCTQDPSGRPKSFDHGVDAEVGAGERGDLLMITGPVGVRMEKGRLIPRVESGEIAGYDPPTRERVRQWFEDAPVIGRDLFLKLHTHGAVERNLEPLLRNGLEDVFRWVAEEASRRGMQVRWATGWEMYQAVDHLIHGRDPVCNGKLALGEAVS